MMTTNPLNKWAIFFTTKDANDIDNLFQTMKKVATPLGFMIQPPEK
jgi:hypothetical protein